MSHLHKKIYIACPWDPVGGGMFKVADYLTQGQTPQSVPAAVRAELVPLDTRGGGRAVASALHLATAMGRLAVSRLKGEVAGVHVNMAERLSLVRKCIMVLWARALGLPVVLHLHAAQLHHFYRALPSAARVLVRWTFSKATRVVVLGRAAQEFVTRELGVRIERTEIVINGVPAGQLPRRVRAPGAPKRLLFLGNLSERKGVSDLLQALAQSVALRGGTLEAVIAGGGDVLGYEAKARTLGLESAVRFVGWADQIQAASLMASADMLVLPSYDEGLPLVILEALGHGVAVIATPVGEIPDELHDGEDVLLVNPGDVPALAGAIDRLASDDALQARLEEAGQCLYRRRYSLDQFGDAIARVHQACFGCAARPVPNTESP